MPDFSAQESGLGYLYQARYALWLLLDGPEEREAVLETLDDIVFEQQGVSNDLLQTKHHTVPANLTDSSAELWKTLRIWSSRIADKQVQVPPTTFSLITTARAPDASIAQMLRPGPGRNTEAAHKKLREVCEASENASLSAAFGSFSALSDEQQRDLVESCFVIDNSPDITGVADLIRNRIRGAVDREHREALYERLEGWWFGKTIDQLRSKQPMAVAGFEIYDKLRSIAQQFGPAALPIDYLDAKPDSLEPYGDTRMFVRQLRAIDIATPRIEKAILDYYRAFEQRSRWAREELLIGDEVEAYERRLVDEWERYSSAVREDLDSTISEVQLKKAGRQIFNWMEQTADFRIRANVAEPYVMRGSFHMLADRPSPGVWWHPQFLDKLAELLGTQQSATS